MALCYKVLRLIFQFLFINFLVPGNRVGYTIGLLPVKNPCAIAYLIVFGLVFLSGLGALTLKQKRLSQKDSLFLYYAGVFFE